MAQHQDLRVLPPRLPPRQAQHRHCTGHDQENQLQAHRPKIIPSPDGPKTCPPAPERGTEPTAICEASAHVAQVFGTHNIQGGNVLFTARPAGARTAGRTGTGPLAAELEQAIAASTGVRARAVVLSREELARCVHDNPYPGETNPRLLHAVFLPEVPGPGL
ncbi:MAG: DUF1697 domain-containing protein, partial [Streptosporangiaceae bacterium]